MRAVKRIRVSTISFNYSESIIINFKSTTSSKNNFLRVLLASNLSFCSKKIDFSKEKFKLQLRLKSRIAEILQIKRICNENFP